MVVIPRVKMKTCKFYEKNKSGCIRNASGNGVSQLSSEKIVLASYGLTLIDFNFNKWDLATIGQWLSF